MTIVNPQGKKKGKSTAKFCINLCVALMLLVSLIGVFIGIVILGGSEKPDADSLTKLVSCNVKDVVSSNCTLNCQLTVYVPLLGKSLTTEYFSSSDTAYSYTSGKTIDCYVNTFYENYESPKVSVNSVQTAYSFILSLIGGVFIGVSLLSLLITFGLSYYSCAMLIRP